MARVQTASQEELRTEELKNEGVERNANCFSTCNLRFSILNAFRPPRSESRRFAHDAAIFGGFDSAGLRVDVDGVGIALPGPRKGVAHGPQFVYRGRVLRNALEADAIREPLVVQ